MTILNAIVIKDRAWMVTDSMVATAMRGGRGGLALTASEALAAIGAHGRHEHQPLGEMDKLVVSELGRFAVGWAGYLAPVLAMMPMVQPFASFDALEDELFTVLQAVQRSTRRDELALQGAVVGWSRRRARAAGLAFAVDEKQTNVLPMQTAVHPVPDNAASDYRKLHAQLMAAKEGQDGPAALIALAKHQSRAAVEGRRPGLPGGTLRLATLTRGGVKVQELAAREWVAQPRGE